MVPIILNNKEERTYEVFLNFRQFNVQANHDGPVDVVSVWSDLLVGLVQNAVQEAAADC